MENTIVNIQKKYKKLVDFLIEKKLKITTMESITGGIIASLITDNEGSSAIFKGGMVTYSNEAKIQCGVQKEVIKQYGIYSHETARAMAIAAAKDINADMAIGVTGTANNPDPANADSMPGEVFFSICLKKSLIEKKQVEHLEIRDKMITVDDMVCINKKIIVSKADNRLLSKLLIADEVAEEILLICELI